MQINIHKNHDYNNPQLMPFILKNNEEELLLYLLNNNKVDFIYTALIENNIVGVLLAWKNSMHPYCLYFRIITDDLIYTVDIEKGLLDKLSKSTNQLPLQTSIADIYTDSKKVYEDIGFKLIRKTYMPKLDLMNVKIDWSKSEGYELFSLEKWLNNDKKLLELASLVKENYEETHLDNPVVELSSEEWKRMIFTNDLIIEGSFVSYDSVKQAIIAYSFLHEGESSREYELGLCGSSSGYCLESIVPLVNRQINYCIEQRIEMLKGEFDTTSKYAMKVISSFPFSPCSVWLTYQLRN